MRQLLHSPELRRDSKGLLESELFGYEDGAFTGARKGGKLGKVQAADKGTLLLDEINELPLELQAKLLRVIQEREIDKLGGLKSIRVDFRLICSTNKSLPDLIAAKAFREDLYYRINVLEIFVPPLRDRRDAHPLLVRHFIGQINGDLGLHVEDVDEDALDLLRRYDWRATCDNWLTRWSAPQFEGNGRFVSG